jgi:hypothetical protein
MRNVNKNLVDMPQMQQDQNYLLLTNYLKNDYDGI